MANFDAVCLIAHIDCVVLDVLVDLACGIDERFFYIVCRFGAGFKEDESMLLSKALAFFVRNSTLVIGQIRLVANKHDGHVGVSMLLSIFKPGVQMVECLSPANVVHKQSTCCTTIVGACDGAEVLLTSGIPDLKLHLLAIDGAHACTELHPNGEVVHVLKALVSELQ